MLIWLSGVDNEAEAPNENYGREMMELFTLGASDEPGYPYSEDDVREQARALTGGRPTGSTTSATRTSASIPSATTAARRRSSARRGAFDWSDSCRLCIAHKAHRTFFVTKLWSYFVPTPPSRKTRKALEHLYVAARPRDSPGG